MLSADTCDYELALEATPELWSAFNPYEQLAEASEVSALVIHGGADEIVLLATSERFVAELAANGGDVEFVVLPGAGHDVAGSAATVSDLVDGWMAERLVPEERSTLLDGEVFNTAIAEAILSEAASVAVAGAAIADAGGEVTLEAEISTIDDDVAWLQVNGWLPAIEGANDDQQARSNFGSDIDWLEANGWTEPSAASGRP